MKVSIGRLVLCISVAAAAWSQGTPGPFVKQQYFSNSGLPLAGGSLCSSTSGTTSPLATFADYSLTSANPQCVILDAAGRAAIWLDPTKTYRFVLRDSTGVIIWSQDGIPGSGSGSSGGTLWTQSGSTIYNSSGSKVCIGATACTTALATFNVAGTGSGSTHLVRIDDSAGNPGVDLYGSGSFLGAYFADSTGLRLRSANGSNQITVANGGVTVQNGAASGGTTLNLKMSAAQGSVNPLQVQTSAGNNVAYFDPSGFLFGAGLNANSTNTDTIQAPVGGVTAKWLIGTDSLFLIEEPVPALSAASQARVYADSASHTLLISQNGGAYVPLGGGGGSSLFSSILTGTNATATMTVGTGASLLFSGSGIVDASKVHGTTVAASSAADQLLLTSAANVSAWSGVPACGDTGGNHLNYTNGGGFTCGTTGGTVGSVAFSAITGSGATSTNTGAAMVVGSGASLTVSGTGTINATAINGGAAPVSGAIWKSNGTLQPVGAGFADVVAMFTGGAGCSGANALAANGTCVSVGGAGTFLPISGGTMTGNILFNTLVDVGSSANPPRNVWAGTSFTSLNNASNTLNIPNGGLLALNGTFGSLGNYVILQGATPQMNATSLGASFNFNGSGTGNGNIVFNPGNVGGLSSVQVNGRSFANTTTQSLIINEVGGAAGSGISMKHSGTFDAAWQAGSSAALDVVGNDAFTHRLIVLQTGTTLIGRTSDNGTGALFQVQGGISFTGVLTPPSGVALNGSFSCPAGQHFSQLIVSQGLITNYSCTP